MRILNLGQFMDPRPISVSLALQKNQAHHRDQVFRVEKSNFTLIRHL
jgi:hypothetical protein